MGAQRAGVASWRSSEGGGVQASGGRYSAESGRRDAPPREMDVPVSSLSDADGDSRPRLCEAVEADLEGEAMIARTFQA